jgi:hypothetical protein
VGVGSLFISADLIAYECLCQGLQKKINNVMNSFLKVKRVAIVHLKTTAVFLPVTDFILKRFVSFKTV